MTAHDTLLWSGSELTLVSASFTGQDTLPTVLIDGAAALVRVAGANSVAVRMPGAPGSYTVAVRFHSGDSVAVSPVRTAGGFDTTIQSQPIEWATQWGSGGTVVLGYDMTTGYPYTARRVDLTTGLSTVVPDSLASPACLSQGAGTAVNGGVVVGAGGCSTWYVLMPDGSRGDSLPAYGTMYGAYLGGGRWLSWVNHNLYGKAGAASWQALGPALPWVVLSPDGSRAVPRQAGYDSIPVIDVQTAALAYVIRDGFVSGAAFAPAGDTMIIVKGATHDFAHLVSYATSTGAVLATGDSIGDLTHPVQDLAADGAGGWVYAVERGNELKVVSRSTLRVVTTLAIPGWAPAAGADGYQLFVNAAARRAYVVEYGTGRIFVYRLVP